MTTDTINLWVRDTSDALNTDPTHGEPVIIAIFVRSGMVGGLRRGTVAHAIQFDPVESCLVLCGQNEFMKPSGISLCGRDGRAPP